MGEPRAGDAAKLGARLRELRSRRSLSLRQLARQTEVSPSLLSQIENGKVMPSVDTLSLLARELEVPMASFFTEAAAPPTPPVGGAEVVRRDARATIRLEGGVTWQNLLPREDPGVRFMEIRYEPGADSGEVLLRHAGRDLFLVMEGELTFQVGFAEHRVGEGDSISFGHFEPHRVRNEGRRAARAIVCVIGDDGRGRGGASAEEEG